MQDVLLCLLTQKGGNESWFNVIMWHQIWTTILVFFQKSEKFLRNSVNNFPRQWKYILRFFFLIFFFIYHIYVWFNKWHDNCSFNVNVSGHGEWFGLCFKDVKHFPKASSSWDRQDERNSLGHGAVLHPCWTRLHVANVCTKATNTKAVSFGVKRLCCLPLCVGSLWAQKECHLRVGLVLL